ncbi:MAG: hydroxyacid dehydrogenase [Ruminococcaceae bacterium]|nr:hydroxyacid dehydrogenase [Oscillospiraceae bacterium]
MKQIVVLDAGTLGEDIDLYLLDSLGSVTTYFSTSPEQTEERIRDCHVAILNKVKLTKENLPSANNLKLICVTATGYDNIDLEYCREHGIAVCNVKGYSTYSVAQVTVTTVLSLLHHLPQYHEYVTSGQYTKSGIQNCLTPVFHELYGKTWGILGYGNIGKQVARIAQSFGCRVLVHKQTPVDDAECVSLETLCKASDILTLHTPLTPKTKEIIGERELNLMKPTVVLVNAARGAVWEEKAVAQALKEGRIGGLGCDVYSVEPMQLHHPFQEILHLPNLCLTPHMAWGAYEARVRCMEEVKENILAFFKGEVRNRVEGV